MIPNLRKLRSLVQTAAGLATLVAEGAVEHDHLDFKATYNQRDPKFSDEVRKDCAGLATTGEGWLLVGIEESGNGEDRAKKLVGLPLAEAQALRSSVSSLLENKVAPAFGPTERLVRLVLLNETHAAVIVHVRGRRGYPKSVVTEKGETKYLLRVGTNTVWLSEADARVRRRGLDHVRWFVASVALIFVLSAMLALYLRAGLAGQDAKLAKAEKDRVELQARLREANAQVATTTSELMTTKTTLGALEQQVIADRDAVAKRLKPRTINPSRLTGDLRSLPAAEVQIIATPRTSTGSASPGRSRAHSWPLAGRARPS
jgi:molybdopterin converting factor small subunit